MDPYALKIFLAVERERNASKAATRLHLSQSAVSRQIRKLEEELSVPLFHRHSSGMQLTAPGRILLQFAQEWERASAGIHRALEPWRTSAPERVRLGYPAAAFKWAIAPVLQAMRRQNPEIRIDPCEGTVGQLAQQLRAGELDLVLPVALRMTHPGEFASLSMGSVSFAACLPEKHLLALRKSVRIRELAGESFIGLREEHFPKRDQMLQRWCRTAGFSPRIHDIVSSSSAALGLVAAERGIAILPITSVPSLHRQVVFVRISDRFVRTPLGAIWNGGQEGPALRTLLDMLRMNCLDHLRKYIASAESGLSPSTD